jgi:hypothetical protein
MRYDSNTTNLPSAHYAQQTLYNTLKDFDAILKEYGHKNAETVTAHLQDSMEALILRRMRPRQIVGEATTDTAE